MTGEFGARAFKINSSDIHVENMSEQMNINYVIGILIINLILINILITIIIY